MIETSAKTFSRAAGIFLILTMLGGWFGEVQIPSQMMGADAAATAAQLRANEGLFRLGFAAYLVEAFSDVVLAWLFYLLLKPVHRGLALLSAFFGIVSMTLFAATQMFYFSAPLFLKGHAYLTAFTPEQLEAFAGLFLLLSARLSGLFMLFYGAAWMVRGYLTFKSTYLPRFLGVLMLVAGAGFFARNVTRLLAPAISSDLLLAPMFLNVLVLAIWLLVKGVDTDKWNRALRAADERPLSN